MKRNIFTIIILIIILILSAWVVFKDKNTVINKPVAENQITEQEIIDRQAPQEAGLKTFSDDTLSFQYPDPLPLKYIAAQEWPPKVSISSQKGSLCPTTQNPQVAYTVIQKKVLNGREYCSEARNEGAAGSTYTTYTYTTQRDNKTITVSFVLRSVQCQNYDEPNRSQCESERKTFSVDAMVSRLVESIITS